VGAATDFADSTHMFARTVVEGLFGYDRTIQWARARATGVSFHMAQGVGAPLRTSHSNFAQQGEIDFYR